VWCTVQVGGGECGHGTAVAIVIARWCCCCCWLLLLACTFVRHAGSSCQPSLVWDHARLLGV
jgi:hypothetical protein